ncbi:MAG: NADH-quinone oxidoreductase subunit J [bacterium]|nr:NADH-quinone oxidoreductase subunit J [bacterium]
MSAIVVFFVTGILFFLSGSEYNGIVQLAIYGFAIPIVLGISVMFVNTQQKDKTKDENKTTNFRYAVLLTSLVFIMGIYYLIITSLTINPNSINYTENSVISSFDNIEIFAKGIFNRYAYAFELLSVILTMIVAGLTIWKRRIQ